MTTPLHPSNNNYMHVSDTLIMVTTFVCFVGLSIWHMNILPGAFFGLRSVPPKSDILLLETFH